MENPESRRDFLGGIFTSAGKVVTRRMGKVHEHIASHEPAAESYISLLRAPDSVRLFTHSGSEQLEPLRGGVWAGNGGTVRTPIYSDHSKVILQAPDSEPTRIAIRWQAEIKGVRRYLFDPGDGTGCEWRSENTDRALPWYFMAHDGKRTHGYGVGVRPNARCWWTADRTGLTLWLDVRNGTEGVVLGDRELEVCDVISREGSEDERPFEAMHEFLRILCPRPRLAGHPVYGMNDWYRGSPPDAEQFLETVKVVSELSPNETNRPFAILDAGWPQTQIDMPAFADRVRQEGVRPGLWLRPLIAADSVPEDWRSKRDAKLLDPTNPHVEEFIWEQIDRAVGWGFEILKVESTARDAGWGTAHSNPWAFQDRSRTTAEVINSLYDRIRGAAGQAVILGSGTAGHLSAGVFEVEKALDDTRAIGWPQTIRQCVNSLAYRGARNAAFASVDASAVAFSQGVDLGLASELLRLLGPSGTSLFLSIDPASLGPHEWTAIRDAFGFAALEWPTAEPIDWLNSDHPRKWRIRDEKATFEWIGADGGCETSS